MEQVDRYYRRPRTRMMNTQQTTARTAFRRWTASRGRHTTTTLITGWDTQRVATSHPSVDGSPAAHGLPRTDAMTRSATLPKKWTRPVTRPVMTTPKTGRTRPVYRPAR